MIYITDGMDVLRFQYERFVFFLFLHRPEKNKHLDKSQDIQLWISNELNNTGIRGKTSDPVIIPKNQVLLAQNLLRHWQIANIHVQERTLQETSMEQPISIRLLSCHACLTLQSPFPAKVELKRAERDEESGGYDWQLLKGPRAPSQ